MVIKQPWMDVMLLVEYCNKENNGHCVALLKLYQIYRPSYCLTTVLHSRDHLKASFYINK